MARSSNVYVVIPKGSMTPVAGFTVRHELHSWIEAQAVGFAVYRITDGGRDIKVKDITKDFYE